VKTIYSTTAHETTEEGRIKVLQSTLGQLRLVNIATLDAIMTHFTRLIDLTSADEEYITSLAQAFSPCILRPRFESSLTMNERHSYRLIRDLFAHKDAIFGELKRQSSALGINSSGPQSRARSISTDESNRRAAMEARQRAIVNRSRATSPAARTRHRRDRSSGASEMGRFPINVNVSSPSDRRAVRGTSLDVPTETAPTSASEHAPSVNTQVAESITNGASTESPASTAASISGYSGSPSPPPIPAQPETTASDGSPTPTPTPATPSAEFEKRNSMSRSSARYSGRKPGLGSLSNFPTGPSVGAAGTDSNRSSIAESEPNRVTLEDKPMDD
jgi:hypothetical protein